MNQPLAETIFWIAAAGCVIAEIAILRSIFLVRRVNQPQVIRVASPAGELVWAIIPVLALSVVLVATWQRIQMRESHMRMMQDSHMSLVMSRQVHDQRSRMWHSAATRAPTTTEP